MFRKPKKFRAQRIIVNSDDEDDVKEVGSTEFKLKSKDGTENGCSEKKNSPSDDNVQTLKEIQSNKFNDKSDKKKNKNNKTAEKQGAVSNNASLTGNVLSFEDDIEGG